MSCGDSKGGTDNRSESEGDGGGKKETGMNEEI